MIENFWNCIVKRISATSQNMVKKHLSCWCRNYTHDVMFHYTWVKSMRAREKNNDKIALPKCNAMTFCASCFQFFPPIGLLANLILPLKKCVSIIFSKKRVRGEILICHYRDFIVTKQESSDEVWGWGYGCVSVNRRDSMTLTYFWLIEFFLSSFSLMSLIFLSCCSSLVHDHLFLYCVVPFSVCSIYCDLWFCRCCSLLIFSHCYIIVSSLFSCSPGFVLFLWNKAFFSDL
jgi:hypothetical protein